MSEWIEQEELEKYAGESVRRINSSLWLMAVTSGSYAECYRLIKTVEHLLPYAIVKHWSMCKGKNQQNFLATTSQSSLGHSHPSTLPRRRRKHSGAVKKLSGGKFPLPKLYDSSCGPKEKIPASIVCTVCGEHELTAWHDTDRPQDFHHRFKRDVKHIEFIKSLKDTEMTYTVSGREDLKHIK